jgi:type I restriction enzyme, S subunit
MSKQPPGWVTATLADVTEYISRGKSPKYTHHSSLPVVNQRAIRWFGIQQEHLKYIDPAQFDLWTPERFIRIGDILWNSTGTGTIGRACLVTQRDVEPPKVVDSHVTIVRPNQAAIDPRFLFSWIQSPEIKENISSFATGTTNQIELSRLAIASIQIPIAPLNEQKRIADKLDDLLARVDACRERLDRIPLILKRFRQTVLDLAVSGKLTESWREADPIRISNAVESIQIEPTGDFLGAINSIDYVIPDGWVWLTPDLIKFSDKHSLSIGPFGSNLTVKDYRNVGTPLVFVRDIRTKNFSKTTKFISAEKAKKLWSHRVEPGDLLITKMGDPPGDVAIFPLDRPTSIITADCIRIKVNLEIVSIKLLSLFIESSLIRSLIKEITAGVAQQKISLQRFRSMPLPIPSIDEQEEIVRRVESLFAYADRLEAHYQAARTQVDRLTTTLLTKAFRGELVPQDPNDEPAEVLLERIRAERAAQPAKPKRTQVYRKKNMTKMTEESVNGVKEAIYQLPKDKFSFDELREHLPSNYDLLKDILFALLGEAEPSLKQVFDREEQTIHFVRVDK